MKQFIILIFLLWPIMEAGRKMDAMFLGTGFNIENGEVNHLRMTLEAPYHTLMNFSCSANVSHSLSEQNKYLNNQYENWLAQRSIPVRENAIWRQIRSKNVAIYDNSLYCMKHSCVNLSKKSTCEYSYTHKIELETEAQGILLSLDSHLADLSISVKTDVVHKAILLAELDAYHQYHIYLGYRRVDKIEIIFKTGQGNSSNGHARVSPLCFKLKKIQPLHNAENIELKKFFAGKIIPSTSVGNSAVRLSSILNVKSMCAQPDADTEQLTELSEKYVKEFINQSSLDMPGEKSIMRIALEKKLIRICEDRKIDKQVCLLHFTRKNYKIIDRIIRKQYDDIRTTVLVEFIAPEVSNLHNMLRIYPEITPIEHRIGNFIFEQTVLPEYVGNIGLNLYEFESCDRVNGTLICHGGQSRTREVICFRNLVSNAVFDRKDCFIEMIRNKPCFKYIRENEPVQKCFVGFDSNEHFENLHRKSHERSSISKRFNANEFVWTIWLSAFGLLIATVNIYLVWKFRSQLLNLARKFITEVHSLLQKVSKYLGIKYFEEDVLRRRPELTRCKRTLHLQFESNSI
jgi:hypothetical protein